MTHKELYHKCFCDVDGKLTIAQFPNLSGGMTVGFIVASWIVSTGIMYTILRGGAALAGLWWAYLEVRYGVNYFRRGLGLFVAITIIRGLLSAVL